MRLAIAKFFLFASKVVVFGMISSIAVTAIAVAITDIVYRRREQKRKEKEGEKK